MSRSLLSLASVAALATLAACSDAPLAPAPSSSLTPSAALVVRPVTSVALTFQVGAEWTFDDVGVPGTTYEFSTNAGFKTTVVDNGASDLDPRDGYYKVMVPSAALYTAKAVTLPSRYSFDDASKTGGAFSDPTHATLGAIYLHEKSALFITMTMDGAQVLGQTVKLTGPNGYAKTITDGGAGDEASNGGQGAKDGQIIVSLPSAGGYYLCPVSTPKTYWDAPCQSISATYYDYAYSTTMNWTQKWFIPGLPR